jgi:hypothetical protein
LPVAGADQEQVRDRAARRPVDSAADGFPVQRLAAAGLRVLAGAGALGGLVASVLFWVLALRYPLPGDWLRGSLPAAVALQLLFLAALAAWAILMWRRAGQVGALRAPDYPVITCVAVCTRLLGELCAVAIVAVSLGLAVATLAGQPLLAGTVAGWLGGEGNLPAWAVPVVTVSAALLWPLAGLAFAGGVLFAAYLMAEFMTVVLDYVRDMRRIREAVEARRGEEPGSPGMGPP